MTANGAPKRAAGRKSAPKRTTEAHLVKTILAQLEDDKAEDIVTIDLNGKAALADDMIIASGRSNRHVAAIADHLVEKLKAAGARNLRIEGLPHCDWVLVDSGDVIVHLFKPEVRSFYNLEKLWSEHAPDEPRG
jgi:ribosome-associated protein